MTQRKDMVTIYTTVDGKEFTDRGEAFKHETRVQVTEIVNSFYYTDISAKAIIDGLLAQEERLADILSRKA